MSRQSFSSCNIVPSIFYRPLIFFSFEALIRGLHNGASCIFFGLPIALADTLCHLCRLFADFDNFQFWPIRHQMRRFVSNFAIW
jgi:hypothetical protein